MTPQAAAAQDMAMQRPTHILNAASNLLGIALLIIAGLNVSHIADKSLADETAWFAAVCLATSCLLSYLSLRRGEPGLSVEDRKPRRQKQIRTGSDNGVGFSGTQRDTALVHGHQ